MKTPRFNGSRRGKIACAACPRRVFGRKTPGGLPATVFERRKVRRAAPMGWAHGLRAEKYRPLVQVVGHDADFVARELQRDEDLLLENLPAGATVRFCLTATNAAGESPRSAVVKLKLT